MLLLCLPSEHRALSPREFSAIHSVCVKFDNDFTLVYSDKKSSLEFLCKLLG